MYDVRGVAGVRDDLAGWEGSQGELSAVGFGGGERGPSETDGIEVDEVDLTYRRLVMRLESEGETKETLNHLTVR